MLFRTISYHYKCKDENELKLLKFLCHVSKNVYNTALYELRNSFFKNNSIMSYFELNKIVFNNINSKIINTYQTLCINRCAYHSIKTFLRYQKYKENVKIPRYLKKEGYYPIITDQIRIIERNNKKCIKLPLSNILRTKKMFEYDFNSDSLLKKFVDEIKGIKINDIYFNIPKVIYNNEIHEFRIIKEKYCDYFIVEFTYSTSTKEYGNKDTNTVLGIDIGISNLASCFISNKKTFIIDGKELKSINVLYNKKISYYQSKLKEDVYTSKRINNLRLNRKNIIEDYINKAVDKLIKEAKRNKVSKIIIGWNNGIKNNGIKSDNLSKKKKRKINQQFVGLPLSSFKNKIVNRAEKEGIDTCVVNESYTSKASALDNDSIKSSDSYSGKRIRRGLYRTQNGSIINADINAAINIIRKCNSNELNVQMSRGLTSPNRMYVRR